MISSSQRAQLLWGTAGGLWVVCLVFLAVGIWQGTCADYGVEGLNCWRAIAPHMAWAALYAVPIGVWGIIQVRLEKRSTLPLFPFGVHFFWLLASFLLWLGLHYATATSSVLTTELYDCAALASAARTSIFATCERVVPGQVFGVVLLVAISYAITLILQRSSFERQQASPALGNSIGPPASSFFGTTRRAIWQLDSILQAAPTRAAASPTIGTGAPLGVVIAFNLVSVVALIVLLSWSLESFGLPHEEDAFINPTTGAKIAVLSSVFWVLLAFLMQKVLRAQKYRAELPATLAFGRANFLILFLLNCCVFAIFIIGANWTHRRCVAEFEQFLEDVWKANPGVAMDFMFSGCSSDLLWLSGYLVLAPMTNVIAFRTLRRWCTETK